MTDGLRVELTVLNPRLAANGWIPHRATSGSAGMDLRSLEDGPVTVPPQGVHRFALGFAMHIADPGVAGFILPRSGLGSRGLGLANTVGLIDSDYMGELSVVARNWQPEGGKPITVNPGDRIFQIVFLPVTLASFVEVAAFSGNSERGTGGYGSTGL